MKKIFALCLSILLLSPILSRAETNPEPAKKPDLSMLSTDEVEVYQYGKISNASLIGGGLLGTFFGLGTGHIVEGQYGKKGWIFTVGELGSIAVISVGLAQAVNAGIDCSFGSGNNCSKSGDGLIITGTLAYVGFRIWEIIDVWTTPSRVNAEYDAIKARVESGPAPKHTEMMLAPMMLASDRNGKSTLGLQFLVRF